MADDHEYEAGSDLDTGAEAVAEPAEELAPRKRPEPSAEFDASRKSEEPKPDPDEERAARMGWSPKDQWRGPEDKWVDAKTFVERANPAILLERMDKMAKDYETTVQRMERMNQAALEKQAREYREQIDGLKKQRDRQVIEVARTHGPEEAERHAQEWDDYIAQQAPPQQPVEPSESPEAIAARDAWLAARPFRTDRRFAAAAHAEMDLIVAEMPNASPAQHFAELDRRLAGDFPRIYARQGQQNGAPPADARQMDGVRIGGKKTTNYASRLPAYARQQGERFVKQGLYKSIEDYAKDFAEENA